MPRSFPARIKTAFWLGVKPLGMAVCFRVRPNACGMRDKRIHRFPALVAGKSWPV